MKRKVFAVMMACVATGSVLMAQEEYIPNEADINRFFDTKTMMVLDDNAMSEYNMVMRDIVPAEWKITPFELGSWAKFEKVKSDKSLSFVMMNKVDVEKDKSNVLYLFMCLTLGGPAKNLSAMPDLCSVPIAYLGAKEESYMYKLGIFLRFMQNHVQLLRDNPAIADKNILLYYNKNVQKLGGKTLYLIADELAKDVNTLSKIAKIYDGPVKLVTAADIEKAIADKDPNVVFLHKVGPGKGQKKARCFKILVGADDAQFYYFDYHKTSDKSPDAFLASDFKKLARKN